MKYVSTCIDDTKNIAKKLASSLKAGDVISLSGELGAGKTAFVRGIADYFGYSGDVTSPTFTLVNEYDGTTLPLYHFDAYRLERANRDELDWIDDYLFGEGVCLIEWAEFISPILPDNTIFVDISKFPEKGEDYREITVKNPKGDHIC